MLNAKHQDHQEDDLIRHNLNSQNLLKFAFAERGWYFMNLSEDDYGQLYFCDYSGGDGIVRIKTKSFKEFVNSLIIPEWSDDTYDFKRESKLKDYIPYKITQPKYFSTPFQPEIGLNHFKNCYRYFISKKPTEDRLKNLAISYVNNREILKFLLDNGHNPNQLLFGHRINFDTVLFLVNDLGIDLNKPFDGRFAIHNLLNPTSTADIKVKYQLIHDIIDAKVNIDWSVIGKQLQDGENITALERLKLLNSKYRNYENEEMKRYGERGLPHGSKPFFRSNHIEDVLSNKKELSWKSRLVNRITRSNKR